MFDIDAASFGAKGDGKSDDAGPLQGAINAAAASGSCLHLRPRGTYIVSRELVLSADVEIDGHGAVIGTTNEPLRSVLAISCVANICRLTVNACRVATHAAYLSGAGQSHFTEVVFMMAQRDAVFVEADAVGNDCLRFEKCVFQHSGRVFKKGTVRVTAGSSPIIYGEGTDFTGLRNGDLFHVGDEWLPVDKVLGPDKVQCSIHPVSRGFAEPTAYTAHQGDGYREEPSNETNLTIHRDCLYRGNAGSGASFRGLFGPRVENGQSDFNGAFPFCVGVFGNVITSSFRGCYVEGCGADEAFFLGYAIGITIDTLNCPGPAVRISNPTFNSGTVSNAQGRQAIDPIGGTECNLPTSALVTHKTPPHWRHGAIAFKYAPMPGDFIGWVSIGAEWIPFGKVGP